MLDFSLTTIGKLIIEMFIFSCAGWLMEVTLKSIQYHRFINRGFLIGPYCPIYGCGVVAVTVIVGGIIGYEGGYVETFLTGFVICGALEYFVSWYMEKLFHARWWDYSTKPMNLNGRIWIGNLILFGLGSVVIIKLIDPAMVRLFRSWSNTMIMCSAGAITVLLAADNVVSHFLMNIVKKEIDNREEDNTEEIRLKVKELLSNHKLLLRRIQAAYPNLQARPGYLTKQLKEAKHEMKEATKKAKAELKAATKAAKAEFMQIAGNAKIELESAANETRQEVGKLFGENAKEREARLAKSRAELAAAKEQLLKIQEKFTYHGKK
ncbi:MAG: hypothetical protein EOM18_00780 [Clostridia bacterium]|nr:hypothetical protein [Clostridia bacterium]